jgi:hypothetical protein
VAAERDRGRQDLPGAGRPEPPGDYRVEPHGIRPLIDWIAHYRAFWAEHAERLERLLQKMDE